MEVSHAYLSVLTVQLSTIRNIIHNLDRELIAVRGLLKHETPGVVSFVSRVTG